VLSKLARPRRILRWLWMGGGSCHDCLASSNTEEEFGYSRGGERTSWKARSGIGVVWVVRAHEKSGRLFLSFVLMAQTEKQPDTLHLSK
jgi:hypothetical protein